MSAEQSVLVDAAGRSLRPRRRPPGALPNPLPPILDRRQVAALLRLPDERSVERLVARREIPHFRLGGRILFLTASLLESLAHREIRADVDPRDSVLATLAPRRPRRSAAAR